MSKYQYIIFSSDAFKEPVFFETSEEAIDFAKDTVVESEELTIMEAKLIATVYTGAPIVEMEE